MSITPENNESRNYYQKYVAELDTSNGSSAKVQAMLSRQNFLFLKKHLKTARRNSYNISTFVIFLIKNAYLYHKNCNYLITK